MPVVVENVSDLPFQGPALRGRWQGRRSHRSWGHDPPPLFEAKGTGDKVNVENTKITTENISISVSQLQIKQRN